MKLIFAICIIAIAMKMSYSTSCAATQYCMGCSSTNVCSSCFNWGSGKVGARSLASNTCTATLTRLTTDAKMYSGTFTSTSNWSVGSVFCKDSKYHYVDSTVATPYTSTCSKTAISGVTRVADCEHDAILKSSSTSTVAYCVVCAKGKGGLSTNLGCTGTVITNCDYASGTSCTYCKSKYAVASTGTSCTSFTSDSNCARLASDGTCGSCWSAYYFNATVCKLFAKISVAGIALAISAFFY